MDYLNSLEVNVSQVQGRLPVTVFKLSGRVNLGNSARLERLAAAEYEQGMRDLLIDLSEVPSLSSAGLRAIHSIYKLLEKPPETSKSEDSLFKEPRPAGKSAHLKLCHASEEVKRVLDISGFAIFFDVYEDLEQALEAF